MAERKVKRAQTWEREPPSPAEFFCLFFSLLLHMLELAVPTISTDLCTTGNNPAKSMFAPDRKTSELNELAVFVLKKS